MSRNWKTGGQKNRMGSYVWLSLFGTLFGAVMAVVGGAIYATSGVGVELEPARCDILGARVSCTGLSCTSWVCLFQYESSCSGLVSGEAKRTSIAYNGNGFLKSGHDCLDSIGLTSNASDVQCWRKAHDCGWYTMDGALLPLSPGLPCPLFDRRPVCRALSSCRTSQWQTQARCCNA